MFTGLVEEMGTVIHQQRGAASARLKIGAQKIMEDLAIGDSISVNGICLTVTSFGEGAFTTDVMAETLAKTNLAALQPGHRVNLERALRLGDRLGGHLVSGHIDGVGNITKLEKHDIATLITINAPDEVMRYIIKKGSVAIDGTSLTVVDFTANSFRVSLIPHTAQATVLGAKKIGDAVNLEGDLIGKYVERMLLVGREPNDPLESQGVSMSVLARHGFL